MKMLFGYLKKYKRFVILGPIFKMFEAFLELLNPLLVAEIVDVGVSTGDTSFIIKVGIIILVSNMVAFGFSLISQKCASLTSVGVATEIRDALFKKNFFILAHGIGQVWNGFSCE